MAELYTIYNSKNSGESLSSELSQTSVNYKNGFVEQHHDFSELSLILPDDCLVMAGPPRFSQWSSPAASHVIGYVQGITVQQSSQVQPLKAIGSRRHVFAKTNQPVSVQINRMIFTGSSLLQTLYANHDLKTGGLDKNQKFDAGQSGVTTGSIQAANGHIFTNIEEDIYRVPFGLWVLLNSPALMGNGKSGSHGILIEACTLQSHNMSVEAGQAMIMEQVSIFADRVIGMQYSKAGGGTYNSPASGMDGYVLDWTGN